MQKKLNREKNKKKAQALAKDQKRHKWKYEMIFKKMLEREGIDFYYQKPFYTDSWFYVGDFYIIQLSLLIEIDGRSHKKGHDRIRTDRLVSSGKIKYIIRIKNSDIMQRPRWVYQRVIGVRNRIWDGENKK